MFPSPSPTLFKRTYLIALIITGVIVLVAYQMVAESTQNAPVEDTLRLERFLTVFVLVVLLLEGLLIFRPVDRLLQQQTRALRESEARYEAVIASMAEGMVIQNASGAISLCNPAAEKLLGLTRDQMMGRTSIDPRWRSIHEDGTPFSGEEHPAMLTLKTGKPQRDVVMGIHHPNGELRWILVNSMPLMTPWEMTPHGVVATFSDITQQRALQEIEAQNKVLQATVEKEKELSSLKSRMMERIAHEFRTPLAIIQIAIDTLNRYRDRMTPEQLHAKEESIRLSIQRITDMLDEIGAVVRGSFVPESLTSMPVNLQQLCQEAQVKLEAQFGLPAKYTLDVPGELTVFADPLALGRSLFHILRNAARFSPPEAPVSVTAERHGDDVLVRVTNMGMGIPTAEQPRVFEPFFRANNIGEISGLGLGLTIAQAGIVAHGGSISVESTPGATTTFTLRLPARG
jgi:PAS domain S-box-containing protein